MTHIDIRLVLFAAGLAAVAGVKGADNSELERGEDMYLAHGCYSCHGYNGTGRRPLSSRTSGIVQNNTVFLTYLRARKDIKPSLPRQDMPHYPETSLPNEDALAILAYIKTFDDKPPSVDDAPALRSIREGLDSPAKP